MQIKNELRKELKKKRKLIDKKSEKDAFIRENLICSDFYLDTKTVLLYAALDDEINVDECITDALMLGKQVALPVCINEKGDMKFYYIKSMSDLNTGFFGVREPDVSKCKEATDFSDSICIVPGIAYDKCGYRLGYGKGYYDRFMQNSTSLFIGLCYNELVADELPIGEYDVPVKYIITENGFMAVEQEDKNG